MELFGTAAILAGGRSLRMGFDKQLLRGRDGKLIEGQIAKLSAVFSDIVVVTSMPELYRNMPVRTVSDIIQGGGALSGIHAAVSTACSQYTYIMACDMPRFSTPYIKHLMEILALKPFDACVAARGERIEPFHAFYGKAILPQTEADLLNNLASVYYLVKKLHVYRIPECEQQFFSPDHTLFMNLNTREDYERFLRGELA